MCGIASWNLSVQMHWYIIAPFFILLLVKQGKFFRIFTVLSAIFLPLIGQWRGAAKRGGNGQCIADRITGGERDFESHGASYWAALLIRGPRPRFCSSDNPNNTDPQARFLTNPGLRRLGPGPRLIGRSPGSDCAILSCRSGRRRSSR